MSKKCCFIGHRKIQATETLIKKLDYCLQGLIDNGVRIFLFGSKSQFDSLCHERVTKFKERYCDIKRIAYTCKSEYACNKSEAEKMGKFLQKATNRKIKIEDYDGEEQSERIKRAGKASYIERNEDMINASDYCVFYYNAYYLPPKRKKSKASVNEYQPPSGTSLALDYALRRKRAGKILTIINLYEDKE